MASGIAINPLVQSSFEKLNKREHSVLVLKINDPMTEVSVEKAFAATDSDPETEWKDFVQTVPEKDCRYIVTDFRWKETPTVTKSKIILILWSPDYAPIKSKMIYASSQEAVSAKVSAARSMQATEADELQYSTIKGSLTH